MQSRLKKLQIVLIALICILLPTDDVFAISKSKLKMYSANNIVFYNGDDTECTYDAKPTGSEITWIGDSYSVGAQSIIEEKLSGVNLNAEVSKFVSSGSSSNPSGLEILKDLVNSGSLGKYLVFALGTNGGWTDDSMNEFLSIIEGVNVSVVLVTSRAPKNDYSDSNNILRNAAKSSSQITVADWSNVYQENFFDDDPDKIHPYSNGGYEVWFETIYEALPGESSITAGGKNTNYAGDTVWSEAELTAIAENQAIYEEAANEYGFPWQILAVLHSQETGLKRYNPDNGQGVYQLYSYTDGGTNANRFTPASSISEEEFLRQTKLAAQIVSDWVGDLNDPDNVKKLFFKYNGAAERYIQKALNMGFTQEEAENGEGSVYVMNRYDAERDPTSSSMSVYWPGRYTGDGVYTEGSTTETFGTFVKYQALGGAQVCANNSNIAETAITLSWEGLRSHDKSDPKQEYIAAMKEVGSYQSGCNDSGCAPEGASCDQFVGTVMRYSGADPDFPIFGPGTQETYMLSHPEMYQKIEHNNDISNLQPGDIFVTNTNGNHIYLYVGEIDGQPSQASASFNDRTGEHFAGVYFSDNYGKDGGTRVYSVYRRINY